MNRRNFVKGSLALGGASIFTGLYTWQIEPFWLDFVKNNIQIENLPNELEGTILMQISDMHIGNRFDYHYISESFKKAQKYNPDYVVYTGDFVNWESKQQLDQLEEVFKNVVRGKIGTIGILGNHDYGRNWSEDWVANSVIEILKSKDIRMLRNEKVDLGGLSFLGFDDFWTTNFQPGEAMSQYNPKRANIALCHNPDVVDLQVWNNYSGWILSGHTHGGQCKPPFLDPPMLPVKNKNYTSGQFYLPDGRNLYINRALGHLWQVRFNVRPEITLFSLFKA